jgi:hypothetical protein
VEEEAVSRPLVHHEPLDAASDVGPSGGEVRVLLVISQDDNGPRGVEAKPVLKAVLDTLQVSAGARGAVSRCLGRVTTCMLLLSLSIFCAPSQ